MAHTLITGMTECGKTHLAKALMNGMPLRSIALNPSRLSRFGADFETANQAEFLRVFRQSRSCNVFIDEAGSFVGQYADPDMITTATDGRHYGHACFYLAQRPAMIAKTVREQCRYIFMFRIGPSDAKIMAEDWARPELKLAAELEPYHFIKASKISNDVQMFKTTPAGVEFVRNL